MSHLQWNLSFKGTLNTGHLSNEDSAYCPSYIEMCTKLATSEIGTPL